MAKRENQGMQIALILLAMVTVLLAVTSVVFWNQSKNLGAEADQLRSDTKTANDTVRRVVDENQLLKGMLGYAPDESADTIQQAYQQDMLKFGQYPEENQNYRHLPEYLSSIIQEQYTKLNEANSRIQELEQTNARLAQEKEQEVGVERKARETATQDLLSEREKFAQDRKKAEQDREKETKSFELTRKKMSAENNQLKQDVAELRKQLADMTRRNERLSREKEDLLREDFEHPDGEITWVDQRGQTVYINLGRDDALQRQTTFSVYDLDATNVANARKKGSIEVTRVVGAHLASARILDDDVQNPIVAGDIVYSPIWEVGSPVRFALTGFMDIDGDGGSDRELIRRLITLNGGAIDAEVDDAGNRTGEVTVDTRYLVYGELPTDATRAQRREEDSKLRAEAKTFGVTLISVDELLADIGYQKVSKAVALGADAQPADFPHQDRLRFQPAKKKKP
jgi:hypothetical protein